MPVARRLTLILLQEGHLCLARCWVSARANFFFKLGPYLAPNLFVLDMLSMNGAARIRTGVQWFFCCIYTQTISDSNLKVTFSYLYQATLQPHHLIYKYIA